MAAIAKRCKPGRGSRQGRLGGGHWQRTGMGTISRSTASMAAIIGKNFFSRPATRSASSSPRSPSTASVFLARPRLAASLSAGSATPKGAKTALVLTIMLYGGGDGADRHHPEPTLRSASPDRFLILVARLDAGISRAGRRNGGGSTGLHRRMGRPKVNAGFLGSFQPMQAVAGRVCCLGFRRRGVDHLAARSRDDRGNGAGGFRSCSVLFFSGRSACTCDGNIDETPRPMNGPMREAGNRQAPPTVRRRSRWRAPRLSASRCCGQLALLHSFLNYMPTFTKELRQAEQR